MIFLLLLNIFSSIAFEFDKVSISNGIRNKAAYAFKHEQYLLSIRYYQDLLNTYQVKDESLLLNLSHAYFKIADFDSAARYYKMLAESREKKIRSLVNHQLGVIAAFQGKERLAISYFKYALKANYRNEEARYNYELIAKKLEKERTSGKGKINDRKANTDRNEGNREKPGRTNQDNKGSSSTSSIDSEKENDDNPPTQEEENRMKLPLQNPDKDNHLNDVMMDEKGEDAANALKTLKFNEIHINEVRARQLLESMKEQEFLLLLQISKKTNKPINKIQQDW